MVELVPGSPVLWAVRRRHHDSAASSSAGTWVCEGQRSALLQHDVELLPEARVGGSISKGGEPIRRGPLCHRVRWLDDRGRGIEASDVRATCRTCTKHCPLRCCCTRVASHVSSASGGRAATDPRAAHPCRRPRDEIRHAPASLAPPGPGPGPPFGTRFCCAP